MNRKSVVGFLIATTFFLSACKDEVEIEQTVPLVRTQKISFATKDLAGQNYTGIVRGRYETNLAFQVGGQISARNVQIGSKVARGDILLTINPRDILEQTRQARAQVESAKAQLDLARANLNRFEKLFAEEAISAATLDQYRTNFDAAEAQYQAALAVEASSKNSLEYSNLMADSDGIISNINVEVGQIVAAGQTICTLVQTQELEVVIDVPENRLSEVELGSEVTIDFWALNGRYTGIVREVSPMADSATRTFKTKISIPNPPKNLQLGMTANVQTFSKKNSDESVEIPIASIFQTGDSSQVWIVESNQVKAKSIEVVSLGDKFARVRRIKPGSIIVTAGVHKLVEGQSVRLEGESR